MKRQKNHIDSKKPDKVVAEKYVASYMNNTKWLKLIETLTVKFDQVYLEYKLIYADLVKGYLFDMADFKPYFLEPILYKEIEWIDIPNAFEDWKNVNNRKAGKQYYAQNLELIKHEIDVIGKFEMDIEASKIRIYGYK